MSRVDDLIAELCPDGVEFKALGEVGKLVRGNGLQKKDLTDEGIGAIHYGQVFTHYGTSAHETKSFVSPSLAGRLRKARSGDLVIATTSENDEDVCKAVAWLGDAEIGVSGDAFVYSHTLDPLFVAYFFQTDAFQQQKSRFITGTKVKRVSGAHLARISIPVPPSAVQREISVTLRKMEQLEAELEAELAARRRQYAHYRDAILAFKDRDAVRRLSLGELLAEPLANGRSVPDGLGYPVLRLTALHGPVVDVTEHKRGAWDAVSGRKFRIQRGDLLVARGNGSKALVGRSSKVEETEEYAFPDTVIRIRPNVHLVSQHYLFHVWDCRYTRDAIGSIAKRSSGVWKVSQDDLAKIVIPVPPREEQDRIVAILDSFDSLVNDLASGLPAEIRARRQQYEHYRDRLLTFKELA